MTHKIFVGFYKVDDIKTDTIVSAISDTLTTFNIPLNKLRGQCYVMAASKTGSKNELQRKILQKESRYRDVYSHCYDHALNLACSDTVESFTVLRDALDVTREITKLIKKSLRREAIFRNLKESQNLEISPPGLRVLCPTRWTVRADALQSVVLTFM